MDCGNLFWVFYVDDGNLFNVFHVDRGNLFQVFYVDYGNSEVVAPSRLRRDDAFTQIAQQCLQLELSGIAAVREG